MRRRSAACAVLAVVAAACSRGQVNDAGDYCALLEESRALIDSPLRSSTEIEPRLVVYETLRDGAPLDVEEQWQQVIDLVRAAATVDVSDQSAVADVTDLAFSTARSATEIVEHAARVCGLTLTGPGALPTPEVTISPGTTIAEEPTTS